MSKVKPIASQSHLVDLLYTAQGLWILYTKSDGFYTDYTESDGLYTENDGFHTEKCWILHTIRGRACRKTMDLGRPMGLERGEAAAVTMIQVVLNAF